MNPSQSWQTADDPVTCVMYAKEIDLLHIDGWKRFRKLAKRDKTLTRHVMQSRIRQAIGYLIPRYYKEALGFDKENNNRCKQGRNGLHQRTTSVHKTSKGQMGFKPQVNYKCRSQPLKDQGKLNICSKT